MLLRPTRPDATRPACQHDQYQHTSRLFIHSPISHPPHSRLATIPSRINNCIRLLSVVSSPNAIVSIGQTFVYGPKGDEFACTVAFH
jgi:hypothetical protein